MRSILVVDDSPTVRHAVSTMMREAAGRPLHVHEASEPDEGVKLFRDLAPDVVLLDMVMGEDLDDPEGLQVLKEMLAHRPEARVVLLTGLPANHPAVVEAVNAGAAGFLRKPVRMDDVRALLEALFPDPDRLRYFG